MTSRVHLTKIDGWIGNSVVFEIITNKDKVNTLINNVENLRGAINIEILQFLSTFSVFEEFEKKRLNLARRLASSNDKDERETILQHLLSVEKNQSDFIKNILQIAHIFTKTSLKGDVETAAKHFFEGDVFQANADLNSDRIQNDQIKYLKWIEEKQKLEAAYDHLEENATEFKVKAQLTMVNMEIESPENRFQKAIALFLRGQTSAEFTKRAAFVAEYSFDHGIFLLTNKEYSGAPVHFEKALECYRTLVVEDSNKYSWLLCDTLNNLAIIYKARHELEKADSYYQLALDAVRNNVHLDSDVYRPQLAMITNNIAELKRFRHEFDEAEDWFLNAIRSYRELADYDPDSYLPNLAATLSNLANVFVQTKNFKKAENCNEEALLITRQLIVSEPEKYADDLAERINNQAAIHFEQQEYSRAEEYFNQAVQTFRKLAKDNPQIYLIKVTEALNNMGMLLQQKQELLTAEALYREALDINRELARNYPTRYLPDVARTLNNYAAAKKLLGDFPEAISLMQEQVDIYRELTRNFDKEYNPYFASSLANLAEILQNIGELDNANSLYKEAELLYDKINAITSAYQREYANMLNNYGVLLKISKENIEAEKKLCLALSIRRNLYAQKSQAFLPDVAATLNNLAELYRETGQLNLALPLYNETLEAYQVLAERNPEVFAGSIATTFRNMSLLYKAKRECINAEDKIEEAARIHRLLAEEKPQLYQLELSKTAFVAAIIYSECRQNKKKALSFCEESIRAALPFTQSNPIAKQFISIIKQIVSGWGENELEFVKRIFLT